MIPKQVKNIQKLVAGAGAAALLSGSFVPLPALSIEGTRPTCSFELIAPDGATASPVELYVTWDYKLYPNGTTGVAPKSIGLWNRTGRSITISTDRWEAGTTVYRGPGGTIPAGGYKALSDGVWNLHYFPVSLSPHLNVQAYATSRPGMHGGTQCQP